MLSEAKEIEIISRARQKNVRDPNRSRAHFERIFGDFFKPMAFTKRVILDIGPGQYDFGVLAREREAEVHGIDNDPAVLELGRYKGFTVYDGDIKRLQSIHFDQPFDGIFCKFSINAFWYYDDKAAHRNAIRALVALMRDDAWAWLAPWNGIPKNVDLNPESIIEVLRTQAGEFAAHGFTVYELSEGLSKAYGVHGATANRALFTRNLGVPQLLQACVTSD